MELQNSHGIWLGPLRHTPETAAPPIKQFAAAAAEWALTLIRGAHHR
jgi:hypothetical protein